MAKPKRITRKQLLKEPDEFITTTGRIIQWGQRHVRPLSIAGGVIAVLLIVVAAYRYYDNWVENKAFLLLDEAVHKYEAQKASSDAALAYQNTREDFENLVEKYDGTVGGRMAAYVFAGMSNDAGEVDRAIELYEAALKYFKSDPAYRNFIWSGLGYAHEKKEDLEQAVRYFQKIADGSSAVVKDLALFNLGRLYRQTGAVEKSRAAFKRLTTDHPDSIYFQVAQEKVRENRNG